MQKENLSILLIDCPVKESQNIVKDVFKVYGPKYGLLVFPPKEDDPECRIQVVFFEYNLIKEIEDLFSSVRIDYDPDDLEEFFDFDLTEIAEDVFYEVLETKYAISVKKLSEL